MATNRTRAGAWAFAFLILGGAGYAQEGEPQARITKQDLIDAVMRDHGGEPAEALAVVEQALQRAGADARPLLLARKAELLRRLGRTEAARETYVELAATSPQLRSYAMTRSAELDGGGSPSEPQDPVPDALRQWIRTLDRGSLRGAEGIVQALENLGALAIPALLAEMGSFGPDGLEHAFRLAAPSGDPRVVQRIEQYLAPGQDALRRRAAAEALALLPREPRVRLATEALQADAALIRIAAARALLGTGASTERLVDALHGLMGDAGSPHAAHAVEILAHPSLHDVQRIDGWLEELAADGESELQYAAIAAWFARHPGTDERVAFFDGLPPSGKTRAVTLVSSQPHVAPELALAVLGSADGHQAEGLLQRDIPRNQLRAAPGAVSDLLRRLTESRSDEHDVAMVVDLARELRLDAVVPVLQQMLDSPNAYYRKFAFAALRDLAPRVIAERATDLMPEFGADVLTVLTEGASPETIPALVARIRDGAFVAAFGEATPDPRKVSNQELLKACEAIGAHSDATNLDAVLDLVTVPAAGVSPGDFATSADAAQLALGRWFGAQHLAPALERIHTLDAEVAETLLAAAERSVGPEHRDAVLAALERARAGDLTVADPQFDQRRLRPVSPRTVARGAIDLLAAIGDAAAVDVLLSLLDDPRLGEKAVDGLSDIEGFDDRALHVRILGDPKLWRFAPAVLADPRTARDEELRQAATQALSSWPVTDEPEPSGAGEFLAALPPEKRKELATTLLERRQEGQPLHRTLTLDALAALGGFESPDVVPTIALALDHPDEYVRRTAVKNLWRTYSPLAGRYLIDALRDESKVVAEEARNALDDIATTLEEAQVWRARFDALQSETPPKKDGG